MPHLISPLHALILGIVEGLTEFLPVSSTGHLILTTHWLGLEGAPGSDIEAGVNAFNIVIQAGALLAVVGLYWPHIVRMLRGVTGRDRAGLQLFTQLITAFLPAAVVGLLLNDWIKAHLFTVTPVIAALITGGVVMIIIEHWRLRGVAKGEAHAVAGRELGAMTLRLALIIGFAQCLAMWPGTSRSMVTIVAALLLGFSPRAAAEFSFLLALPTLGAATAYDLLDHGPEIMLASGPLALAIGFVTSCVVAWLAVKGFLAFLTRRGLAIFGWYRIALGIVVALVLM